MNTTSNTTRTSASRCRLLTVLLAGASSTTDAQVQEQASQYRALAQTLREMALLEANMQNIAQTGQQVLHRLTHVEKTN